MASPQGFFVEISSLPEWDNSAFDPRNWFNKIFEIFGQPDSPNHIETLVLTYFAVNNNGTIELIKDRENADMLDRIKDFLPKFDSLFVAASPDNVPLDITKHHSRSRHIKFCKDAGKLFMKYMRDNNITVPIHWYITPEANITSFGNTSGSDFNSYISEYIEVMSDLIQEYIPEFLWSPYFVATFMDQDTRDRVIGTLRHILTSNPGLSRLHAQDGVGARSQIHPDGLITYNQTIEQVIAYYNNILVPAAAGTNVDKNNRINMELFVMDHNFDPPPIYFGVEAEQQYRQSKYMQANVPLGVCFEIRYWYGSLYYRRVPNALGMGTRIAKQLIEQADLVPKVTGVQEQSYIKNQSPPASQIQPNGVITYNYVEKGSIVNLTTDASSTTVIVPGVIGAKARVARRVILQAGLAPNFDGDQTNTVVGEQSPEGGDKVERGSEVALTMTENVRRIPRRESH